MQAERTGTQVGLLTKAHPEMGMMMPMRLQNAIYRAKLVEGRRVVWLEDWVTSKAMQYALNIDIPDSGILFDDMLFDHESTVPAGRFIQPRIEAEIAFVLKAPLGGSDARATT